MHIIEKLQIEDLTHPKELVVVIDVIRAFTTAAFAFAKKAKKIIPVKDTEDAFKLKKQHQDWLLMGEAGKKISAST